MKNILFALVFLFSFQIFAKELKDDSVTRINVLKEVRQFWMLYSENGISKIDLVEEKKNQAQQLVKSWGFSNYEKAREFYNSKTKSFPEFTVDQWQSETWQVASLKALKLWEPTNTWSWDWELKYADWIAKNVDKTFMQKYQMPSDCADLAYILRWIFARDHSLPMATKLSGTGKFMTHETVLKEWEKLSTDPDWSKDKRFRAALKYVTGQTYTHTLIDDSYPIALNSDAFTEGVHHLHLRDHTGHTMLVHRVDRSGGVPVQVLYSNMPIEVRELYEAPFTDSTWPQDGIVSFLRFRWPQKTSSGWGLVAKTKMPFYSLEQFSEELKNEGEAFFIVVFKRISPHFDPKRLVNDTIDSVIAQFANRVNVVEEGAKFCQTNSCEPGTDGDENWSTPSRDRRIRETLGALDLAYSMYKKLVPSDTMPVEFKNKFDAFRVTTNGKSIGFNHAFLAMIFEFASSDPRVSISERWALDMPSVVTSAEKILNNLFTQRDLKVQQSKRCTLATCPWGSPEWINNSTGDLDLQIGRVVNRLTNLCYILADDCTDLNNAFTGNANIRKLISRAVTQQTSPYASPEKKRGTDLKKVSVVPGTEELINISPNYFYQSRKVFEQKTDQFFPKIICPAAQISSEQFVVCSQADGIKLTTFSFFSPQMQLLKTITIDTGTINMILDYGWVDKSDLFYLSQFQTVSVYNKDGSLISVIDKPSYADIKGQRWMHKLEEKHYMLDLKKPQKGWIPQDVPANEVGAALQAIALSFPEDRLLFYNNEKMFLTNESGQRVLEMNERIMHSINNYEYIATIPKDVTPGKIIRLYKFEGGTFKQYMQIPLQADAKIELLQFVATESGFYINNQSNWSFVDIKTKAIESLPWLSNKLIWSMIGDYVISLVSESDLHETLWTRSGQKVLDTDYVLIEKDILNNRFSMSLMTEKMFVNHVFKDQNTMDDAIFSNTGFTYQFPDKITQQPVKNPTYFFTQRGNYKEIKFLYWLGVQISDEFSMKIAE